MVQVLSATVFLVLLARALRMPVGTWRFIVAGAVLVLAGSQLLPVGTPLREDVRASFGALAWVLLAALPVLAYALSIRAIRRRTLPREAQEAAPRPQGLVLIPDDDALARDTEASLAREDGAGVEHVSVAWREAGGELLGHARLRLRRDLADLELLWVAVPARGRGIGSRLLGQAETEARLRGARGMAATVWSEETARFLARHDFRPYGSVGARVHLHKALS